MSASWSSKKFEFHQPAAEHATRGIFAPCRPICLRRTRMFLGRDDPRIIVRRSRALKIRRNQMRKLSQVASSFSFIVRWYSTMREKPLLLANYSLTVFLEDIGRLSIDKRRLTRFRGLSFYSNFSLRLEASMPSQYFEKVLQKYGADAQVHAHCEPCRTLTHQHPRRDATGSVSISSQTMRTNLNVPLLSHRSKSYCDQLDTGTRNLFPSLDSLNNIHHEHLTRGH